MATYASHLGDGKQMKSLPFTFEWCPAIKFRSVPHNGGSVLSHRDAFDMLGGIRHV